MVAAVAPSSKERLFESGANRSRPDISWVQVQLFRSTTLMLPFGASERVFEGTQSAARIALKSCTSIPSSKNGRQSLSAKAFASRMGISAPRSSVSVANGSWAGQAA